MMEPVESLRRPVELENPTGDAARIAHAGGRPPPNRIDAVMALAMAVDRAENQPEPMRMLGWL
jgi:hypothetical protein